MSSAAAAPANIVTTVTVAVQLLPTVYICF
jgi:hypothetical protein